MTTRFRGGELQTSAHHSHLASAFGCCPLVASERPLSPLSVDDESHPTSCSHSTRLGLRSATTEPRCSLLLRPIAFGTCTL